MSYGHIVAFVQVASTGDLVRYEIKNKTELGKRFKEISEHGKLVFIFLRVYQFKLYLKLLVIWTLRHFLNSIVFRLTTKQSFRWPDHASLTQTVAPRVSFLTDFLPPVFFMRTTHGQLCASTLYIATLQKYCSEWFRVFLSSVHQADTLHEFAGLNVVINFNLPLEMLVEKTTSRRVCEYCGDWYSSIITPCILHFQDLDPPWSFLFISYNLANIQCGEYSMPSLQPKEHGLCDKVRITYLSFYVTL